MPACASKGDMLELNTFKVSKDTEMANSKNNLAYCVFSFFIWVARKYVLAYSRT